MGCGFPTAEVVRFLSWPHQLSDVDWLVIWYYKNYAEVGWKCVVTDGMIWKGLGARGCCPIPLVVREVFVSPEFLLNLQTAGPLFSKSAVPLAEFKACCWDLAPSTSHAWSPSLAWGRTRPAFVDSRNDLNDNEGSEGLFVKGLNQSRWNPEKNHRLQVIIFR